MVCDLPLQDDRGGPSGDDDEPRKGGVGGAIPILFAFALFIFLPQLGAEFFSITVTRPRWHVFIVEDGAQPIAVGGMFVDGAYAYFAFAATRPECRGRGAQRALMQARAELACSLGCEWLVTETGFPLTADEPSPSYHNMLWAGFRAVAIRDNFGLPGLTLVVVTHSQEVGDWAGRLIRMRDGQIISDDAAVPRQRDDVPA